MDNSKIVIKHVDDKDESISKVKFITDDDLKVFVREIQTIFKDELHETISLGQERNCERMLEIQYMIRKYIIDNQKRINFSEIVTLKEKSPCSMTSLFGLYMMVVADVEPIKTVVDVLRQVEHNYYVSMDRAVEGDASGLYAVHAVFYGTEIHQNMLCCCSHKCHIQNMGIIKNMITNYHVVVGSDCIKKNHLIDKDVIKQEYQKTNKFLKNKEKQLAIRTQKKIEKNKLERQNEEEYERRCEITRIELITVTEKEKEEDEKKREIENAIVMRRTELVNDIRRNNIPFYIQVGYRDKDTAKTLGAWWDNDARSWYIRPNSMNIYTLLEKYYKF